jgi:hypothetical protein
VTYPDNEQPDPDDLVKDAVVSDYFTETAEERRKRHEARSGAMRIRPWLADPTERTRKEN